VSEQEFTDTVVELAGWGRWRVVHIRNIKLADGRWTVPYQGDLGLPDLILARGGVVLLAELKVGRNKPKPEQALWLEAAGPCGRLWYPSDLPAIRTELLARAA
jgi:hypothetical protein